MQARADVPQSALTGAFKGDFAMKLAGKVALVTGAQQGIGAAIATALAGEGADVALTWLDDRAGAEAVAARVKAAGRRAHLIKADVSKLAEVEAMVAETVREFGPPDILVNNAGVYPRVPLLEMRERDWDHVLDINLKAGCFATIASNKTRPNPSYLLGKMNKSIFDKNSLIYSVLPSQCTLLLTPNELHKSINSFCK